MLVRVVLAVDDEKTVTRFEQILNNADVLVDSVHGVENLWETLSGENVDIVILQDSILGSSVSEIVNSFRTLPDSPDVVVLCNREDSEERAALLSAGCMSVLNTGLPDSALDDAFASLIIRRLQAAEELLVSIEAPSTPQLADFISESPAMQAFMDVVQRVVGSDTSLLILGETGVGKERLARAIHGESPRSSGPFISVNCGALPESLLESELFGHEEGAFTGASRARRGWFELAHNGTIFLDEIGEMPKHLQVKLLTVLQTREVQRVGAEASMSVDVRIVAATNRDLPEDVESGAFRRDLYYRLGVVSLVIPPLRERKEDIPSLAQNLLGHLGRELPNRIRLITRDAMLAMCEYDWPGNIRELMNVIERAMLLSKDDEIGLEDLPVNISGLFGNQISQLPSPTVIQEERLRVPSAWIKLPLRAAREKLLNEFERAYLSSLLEVTRGRVGETAKQAGIQPRSLYEKMKELGLNKEDFKGK